METMTEDLIENTIVFWGSWIFGLLFVVLAGFSLYERVRKERDVKQRKAELKDDLLQLQKKQKELLEKYFDHGPDSAWARRNKQFLDTMNSLIKNVEDFSKKNPADVEEKELEKMETSILRLKILFDLIKWLRFRLVSSLFFISIDFLF
jgi:hypothetical protein